MDHSVKPAPYFSSVKAKGWRFELDIERIQQSDTWAIAPLEVRPWLLMVWVVAWGQCPCGSLPSDEQVLCARLGITSKLFQKHKAVLLRGWWLADDGRYYHDTIIERVNEMLAKRMTEAQRKAAYRKKKESERQELDSCGTPTGQIDVPQMSHGTNTGLTWESHGSATPEPEPEPVIPKENKEGLPSLQKKSPIRGTRLDPNWVLPPEWEAWAIAEKPGIDTRKTADHFRDYWIAIPGQKGVKLDWESTWRNWVRGARVETKSPSGTLALLSKAGRETAQACVQAHGMLFGGGVHVGS